MTQENHHKADKLAILSQKLSTTAPNLHARGNRVAHRGGKNTHQKHQIHREASIHRRGSIAANHSSSLNHSSRTYMHELSPYYNAKTTG